MLTGVLKVEASPKSRPPARELAKSRVGALQATAVLPQSTHSIEVSETYLDKYIDAIATRYLRQLGTSSPNKGMEASTTKHLQQLDSSSPNHGKYLSISP